MPSLTVRTSAAGIISSASASRAGKRASTSSRLLGGDPGSGDSELGPAFRFAFYNTLARSIFTEQPELSQVTGVTQEQVRQQFAAADREAIRLYSERVAALIDRRSVPDGEQSGPVQGLDRDGAGRQGNQQAEAPYSPSAS